jgi:hypothetical protein
MEVGAKTNEIPLFTALPDRIEITDAVITAMRCTPSASTPAILPAAQQAHYLITVKGNQPGLYAQLAALPWRDVPVAYTKREHGSCRPPAGCCRSAGVSTAGLSSTSWPSACQARAGRVTP